MAASFFLYFMFFGLMIPYLSPALLHLGFDRGDTGLIIAGLYLINTVMPILGGRLSDKYASADRVIRVCTIGMTVFAALTWWQASATTTFLVLLLVMGIFRGPMIPMLDATAMSVVDGDPRRFSRLRMFGSIGFAVAATGMGFLVASHDVGVFFPVVFGICAALMICTWTVLPAERKTVATHEPGRGFWKTLNRSWWIWVAALVCHWLAFAPYHYGYTLFMQEEGLPDRYSGIVWALAVITETGFFFISGWFFARFSFKSVLMIAFASNLVRWLVLTIYPAPWMIVVTQLLHGPGFALFYAAAIQGISFYCGGVDRASYQGVLITAVNGFASIIGSALAGALHDHMPFRELLLWFVPVQILGMVILASSKLHPIRGRHTYTHSDLGARAEQVKDKPSTS